MPLHGMPTSRRSRTLVTAVAVASLSILGTTGTASAGDRGNRVEVIESQDDCDPTTFNAELGPDACVGDGDTEFEELIEELIEDGEHGKWRFHSDEETVRLGDTVRISGAGGEFHTFTEVAEFGGGCVEELNAILGLTPVAECGDLVEVAPGVMIPRGFVETGVPPGGTHDVPPLAKGEHKFECLIHPWMHATVTVRDHRH